MVICCHCQQTHSPIHLFTEHAVLSLVRCKTSRAGIAIPKCGIHNVNCT